MEASSRKSSAPVAFVRRRDSSRAATNPAVTVMVATTIP